MFASPGTRSDHRSPLLRGRARGPLEDLGKSGTAKLVNFRHAAFQRFVVTLTGNVTFTFRNPVDGGTYAFLIDTGAGSFTATWPSNVAWPSGLGPTISSAANKVDLITFIYRASADKFYGSFNQTY